ncbi:MAG: 1,4-dihydroxy-6-naphthoate synthase [Bacteroidetes bacterium]|nr:1,4-dihydroxy-6-naphthoate synthase [Bacteroidota bacterium]
MKYRELNIGYSPCPNDCFIFDALVHNKIDTNGIKFIPHLFDVETLNQKAFKGELHITKLSFHALLYVLNNYTLLNSGAALGFNCGPLLITKNSAVIEVFNSRPSTNKNLTIAIPGRYTTANFLFTLAFSEYKNKKEVVFSEIEDLVLAENVDAGLIIHENRFTYAEKGLLKVIDLGEWWQQKTNCPIPLGGIAIRNNLPEGLKKEVSALIAKSVAFAFEHPNESNNYVKNHAQEMSDDVIKKHIALYVNKYSINLAEQGKNAVQTLFNYARNADIISKTKTEIELI